MENKCENCIALNMCDAIIGDCDAVIGYAYTIYNKAIDDMVAIIKDMQETATAMMWTESEYACARFIEQAEQLKEGWKE